MSVGKFWARTTLLIFSIPFFYILIFLLPYYNHMVFNLCAVITAAFGSLEVENLFRKKGIPTLRYTFSLLSGTLPLATYLEITGVIGNNLSHGWFMALVGLVLLSGLWVRKNEDIAILLQRTASSMLILIYPALFISFIVRLTGLRGSSLALLFFFSLVLLNDIMAYLAGKFLGQRSRLNLRISPNKTGIGFAAGFLASVAISLLFKILFPDFLPAGFLMMGVFGAVIGAAAILGDLVESALKRSARVKDSSAVIPGRGGILDSVDSWLISAPVFYFVLKAISR